MTADTTAGIIWESPPDPTSRQSAGSQTGGSIPWEELRNRPGEWARVSEHESAAAARMSMRRHRHRIGPGFELTVRTVYGGGVGGYLYARFIGENREHWEQGAAVQTTYSDGTKLPES